MPDIPQAFIDRSRELLTRDYLPRIRLCMGQLRDQDIWWRPNAESNSIGNLTLHLAGNLRQWLVSGVGGAPDVRSRDQEFSELGPVRRSELLELLGTTVGEADQTLADVDPAALHQRRTIQGQEVTILEAIYHAVEHFSMHTGQIILLTKMWRGDLGFYKVEDGVALPQWNPEAKRRSGGDEQ
jgi:uncharacterized damage-inducible protein DinB